MATAAKPKAPSLKTTVDWVVPAAAVSMIFVMLVPLPSFILDILLAFSMTASVLVLLTALQILRPAQFSVFPSLLLLMALIAIQYLVVSHGAVRTAEVTARFTLDAMPGKQMAIDADLNAGLIDEHQARARREQIAHEAEFYGAMDGAARFNQRDSLATILITAINIIAGFLIGVLQQGVPFQEALKTYTVLTVGDGLVSIIPSLLVSVAGGMVVTRASSDRSLSTDLGAQLFNSSRPLWIASAVMTMLALIPGLPKLSFNLMALIMAALAYRSKSAPEKETKPVTGIVAAKSDGTAPTQTVDPMDAALKLDELMLEVG